MQYHVYLYVYMYVSLSSFLSIYVCIFYPTVGLHYMLQMQSHTFSTCMYAYKISSAFKFLHVNLVKAMFVTKSETRSDKNDCLLHSTHWRTVSPEGLE